MPKVNALDLKTPEELRAASYRAKSAVDNTARTMAVPSLAGAQIKATIFSYATPAIPRKYVVYPPDYMFVLDARSGELLHQGKVYRQALGITGAPMGPEPAAYPRELGAEFWVKLDRLSEISPRVWARWINGETDREGEALEAEYAGLFDEVIEKPLLPYYHAAARDFLTWVSR